MKKIIAILLLLIVPFQFSWAAAGTYCQHEEGKAAHHFGHHSHEHHASSSDTAKDAKDSAAKKLHKDCDYCQHSCQAPLLIHIADIAAVSGNTFGAEYSISFASHIPDGPCRPDRLPAA